MPEAEAASDALNMCADKESREFKKQKSMTKQSLWYWFREKGP
jgi:hypothetical protein